MLQYSQQNTFVKISFQLSCSPEGRLLYQIETPTQVLSREYCEIFKNSYFEKQLQTTASVNSASKLGFIKTTNHRPTDPPATYHLPTDPPTTYPPTYARTEDQILNMFCIL